MIINKTQEIARRNGVATPGELAKRLGVAQNTAYNLWRGNTERIDLPILYRICLEFGVTPGDILVINQELPANKRAPALIAA